MSSMDAYLTAIKDLKEQPVNIDEDILDSKLVYGTLDGLPDSYQGFATTLRLVAMGNADYYSFDQSVALFLQEEQSRTNKNDSVRSDQAFTVSHRYKIYRHFREPSHTGRCGGSLHRPARPLHCRILHNAEARRCTLGDAGISPKMA